MTIVRERNRQSEAPEPVQEAREETVRIKARFPGTCYRCRRPIAAGESAYWRPADHVLICKPCRSEA